MKRFRDFSLRSKLTLLVALASSIGLVTAFLAITLNEVRTFAPQARENLSTQAASIGFHASTAMVFLDAQDAAHALEALHISSDIVAAVLYTSGGDIFAAYHRPGVGGVALPARPGPDGDRFMGRRLALTAPVLHEGERVGTIYLLADLGNLYAQVVTHLGVVALLIVAGILASIMASAFLSRVVTAQVRSLARVAETVTQRKDYSQRAVKRADDEIGLLIDAFNEMMRRIQERDTELQRVQSDLAGRVRERTAELETINRDLSAEVTARKAVEAELIVARDRAEAANRAKSTFLANMSHDLRTPLTAVIGYSEMLSEETRDRGETRYLEDLNRIRTAANHLLSLLSDLLDLSRIEVGRMELQPESVDLSAFLAEVEATARPLCDANRNRFTVTCPTDIGYMRADRTRLRQILFNLLSNAAKFTKRGDVRLTADRINSAQPEAIRFTVTDTGIGMSDDQQARVFEPFVQAEPSTALLYGGSGLGLAICRKCCELMNGSITVRSTSGQGTTFTVHIPCSTPPSAS